MLTSTPQFGPSLLIIISTYVSNRHLDLLLLYCFFGYLIKLITKSREQVKNEWLHNSGAGVVAHVADSIKQVDSNPLLAASL